MNRVLITVGDAAVVTADGGLGSRSSGLGFKVLRLKHF